MSQLTNKNLATPLTTVQGNNNDKYNPLTRRIRPYARIAQLEAAIALLQETEEDVTVGPIAFNVLEYTGQPTDTQTATIDSLVFEACTDEGSVAADARVGFVIGATARVTYGTNLLAALNATYSPNEHPSLFQTDDETPALANSTKNLYAVHVNGGDTSTGSLYVFNALTPGGLKKEGTAPSLAFSDTLSNAAWKWDNLNKSPGAEVDELDRSFHDKHTVIAGDLTVVQPIVFPVGFTPRSWQVQVRDGDDGALKDAYVGVVTTSAVDGQQFMGFYLKPTPAAGVTVKRAKHTAVVKNNDTAISGFHDLVGKSVDIHSIGWSCGEDPAAALTVTVAKVAAADGSGSVALTTAEDIAGGTQNGKITALAMNVTPAGDYPIALAATEALLFSLIAANGVTDPVQVDFYIDYIEKVEAGDVIHYSVFGN